VPVPRVGHPIATAVTEGLTELAAAKIGMDPPRSAGAISRRRRAPLARPSGIKFEALSNHEAMAHLDR
jgi:carbon-monoxide dehydrogenase large subunit